MGYIKNNKMFVILFLCYSVLIMFLSFFLINGDTTVIDYWVIGNTYTENNIEYFNASFKEDRDAIEFTWNVQLAKSSVEKYEICYGDVILREGMNASSALISVVEFDIPTGNNKFDLKIYLKNDTVLEKSVYLYLNEVFDFEVSETLSGNSILYTVYYTYDDRNPASVPQFAINNFSQPFTLNFVSANVDSTTNHHVRMKAVYELDYVKVEEGRFEFDVSWEFMNYNLIFAETSTIEVIVEE